MRLKNKERKVKPEGLQKQKRNVKPKHRRDAKSRKPRRNAESRKLRRNVKSGKLRRNSKSKKLRLVDEN